VRVKKRVKRGVKKGIKRVKSAPPETYLAGVGVLVGGAAVVLLATTKSGRELLIRTAQLALRPEVDEQASQESDAPEADEQKSQESDAQEDVDNERPRTPTPRGNQKRTPAVTTSPGSQTSCAISDRAAQPQGGARAAPGRRPRRRKASNTWPSSFVKLGVHGLVPSRTSPPRMRRTTDRTGHRDPRSHCERKSCADPARHGTGPAHR
jgi:hypothetical protein